MKLWVFIITVCSSSPLVAQPSGFDKQCSKVREITYQALQRNFADMIDQQLRSSNGYSANGNWKFATTRYSTTVEWSGALSSTIEHYTDERDSISINSWQYLADFGIVADARQAHDLFVAIRSQVAGCVLPVSDSLVVNLQPVVAEELPLTMPDEVAVAELYVLPDLQNSHREIMLMIALEKTKKGLRPLLIIEALETQIKSVLENSGRPVD